MLRRDCQRFLDELRITLAGRRRSSVKEASPSATGRAPTARTASAAEQAESTPPDRPSTYVSEPRDCEPLAKIIGDAVSGIRHIDLQRRGHNARG